jgi:hypothetical protein
MNLDSVYNNYFAHAQLREECAKRGMIVGPTKRCIKKGGALAGPAPKDNSPPSQE